MKKKINISNEELAVISFIIAVLVLVTLFLGITHADPWLAAWRFLIYTVIIIAIIGAVMVLASIVIMTGLEWAINVINEERYLRWYTLFKNNFRKSVGENNGE